MCFVAWDESGEQIVGIFSTIEKAETYCRRTRYGKEYAVEEIAIDELWQEIAEVEDYNEFYRFDFFLEDDKTLKRGYITGGSSVQRHPLPLDVCVKQDTSCWLTVLIPVNAGEKSAKEIAVKAYQEYAATPP